MMNEQLQTPPENLFSPLMQLRDHYARLLAEYEQKTALARAQLNHVEALLSNWSGSDLGNNQTTVKRIDETHLSREPNLPSAQPPNSTLSQAHHEPIELELQNNSFHKPIEVQRKENGFVRTLPNQESNREFNTATTSLQHSTLLPTSTNSPPETIPMLPEFQTITRMQAIEKLLRENIGTVCHIDFIVRSLYGDLEPSLFQIVKGRVHSSLTHGSKKNYWSAIPEEPGCYTFDLSLVVPHETQAKSKAHKPKNNNNNNNKKKPFVLPKTKLVPMLPPFEGKFLIDAIASFLQQNTGKVFSVSEIITGIYGELDSTKLREIRSTVLGELSRGYRIGRFARVPETIGCYTWDLNACDTESLTTART
jgi:hypothetical protein